MTVWDRLDQPALHALGWALFHFVWQGSVVAMLLASVNVLLRRRSADLRYAVAGAALALMTALPAGTFVLLMERAPRAPGVAYAAATESALAAASTAAGAAIERPRALRDALAPAMPGLVLAWCSGVLLLSLRLLGGWTVAQRLRRSGDPGRMAAWQQAAHRLCRQLRVSRPVTVCESLLVEVPTVVGWLRPVILFPPSTLLGLSPLQLEVLLAHELAHVRRYDYLVNLLQSAAETLLFYHPAVWWVSHRMRVEREHCCDDAAVAACGDALAYARALTELEGLRVGSAGLAVAADGGSLFRRIARLVQGAPPHAPAASRGLAAAVALGSLAIIAATPAARVLGPEPPQRLPLSRAIEAARHGVTAEYVRGIAAAGHPGLSLDRLIRLRSHGVGPEYIRELEEAGLGGLSAKDLLELRDQGVSPEYVLQLRAAGYRDVTVSRLVSLRSHGVDPEDVQELRSQGHEGLSAARLIGLRSSGVDAGFVREMKELGYPRLSVSLLIGLRNHGVTPEFVRELKELGYEGLAAGLLVEMRSHGVTPEFIRDVQEAGYRRPAPEDLIQLRDHGVEPGLLAHLEADDREGAAR